MSGKENVNAVAANTHRDHSLETILTFENRDVSQWSVIWSTSQIPGMDNAIGSGGSHRRAVGRRRLRFGALVLGSLMTMHCRIPASALTGGFFVYILLLVLAVVALANPLRHFEVYLGQWSISGPGRAFRIIPMLDGIGIAICINAIVRAINCCTIAAIAAIYVLHSVADTQLPFTYCRDFNLKAYTPILKDLKTVMLQQSRFSMETGLVDISHVTSSTTVGLNPNAWRNATSFVQDDQIKYGEPRKIQMCEETYKGTYPALYSTPSYNFFYVEVVQLRSDHSFGQFNMTLVMSLLSVWGVIWFMLILERLRYGRLIWNNVLSWIMIIPWIWVVCLCVTGAVNLSSMHASLRRAFRIGAKEIIAGVADALEVALYIHSVSVGTEILHGKGLNHYASGHIDPQLNSENIWHSGLLLLLSVLHSTGAAICALVDYIHPERELVAQMQESTLWIIPMYSKCTSIADYSHLMSSLIFGGLMFSYMAVAFILLKTALHTIFEYRVKLVFVEQVVVGGLVLSCIALSLLFATNGGIALLESVDSLMTGVAVSFVCCLELGGLLYVYRGHDFVSDMNVATEENTCSSRLGIQWQIIPFITLATLAMKTFLLLSAEFPKIAIYLAIAPLAGVVIAVPLRACHNAYVFLRPSPRHGT